MNRADFVKALAMLPFVDKLLPGVTEGTLRAPPELALGRKTATGTAMPRYFKPDDVIALSFTTSYDMTPLFQHGGPAVFYEGPRRIEVEMEALASSDLIGRLENGHAIEYDGPMGGWNMGNVRMRMQPKEWQLAWRADEIATIYIRGEAIYAERYE